MLRSSISGGSIDRLPKQNLIELAKGQTGQSNQPEQRRSIRQHFNYPGLFKQLHPKQFFASTILFWKQVPHFFWTFFIESFLIPAYRPEWTIYSAWKVISDEDSDGEPDASRRRVIKKRKRKTVPDGSFRLTSTIPKAVKHNHSQCRIITINVSGRKFQTQLRTLNLFPDTLLGDPKRRAQFYDPIHDDYFIDRSISCFSAILYYYQSRGILRRPYNISLDMFEEEIRFYDLGADVIEKLRRDEGILMDAEKPVPRRLLQRKFWLLFEFPDSSNQARIVAVLSVTVVLISVILFCIETLDSFQRSASDLEDLLKDNKVSISDPFFFTETACMFWFVFEFVFRAINAPRKSVFFKSVSNIIDLLAILPYFISLALLQKEDIANKNLNKTTSFTVFRVIRLVRVFRILKLSRHNRGLKVLGKTLQASIRELALLMFFLIIGVVLFSSAVYFAEVNHPNTNFHSIIDAFWWSVITMTTCGYGDDVPYTIVGRIVGALCAISGVLTLALPVPVIVSNFNNFYTREDDSIIAHVESDHVSQCPWRSGWYGIDGCVKSDNNGEQEVALNLNMLAWMTGENRPDDSDSDFEPLRKIKYETNIPLRQRMSKMSHIARRVT